MRELIDNVVRWANDRNLIQGSTPEKQLEKTAAELVELTVEVVLDGALPISARPLEESSIKIASELGDVLVTLIVVAEQLGLDVEDCLQHAYNKIKDRRGKMINGKFVKEEDLAREAASSWAGDVDRQGGSFTKEEIENATAWR